MINGVVIKKITKNEDGRGWLGEIYRQDEAEFQPAMSYLSITKPGLVRGPHEHKEQSDFFVFMGPGMFRLFLWDNRPGSPTYQTKEVVDGGEDDSISVLIPPGVVHGYKCISEVPGYVINLPDKLYKGENKQQAVDEIRWEGDPASPFVI